MRHESYTWLPVAVCTHVEAVGILLITTPLHKTYSNGFHELSRFATTFMCTVLLWIVPVSAQLDQIDHFRIQIDTCSTIIRTSNKLLLIKLSTLYCPITVKAYLMLFRPQQVNFLFLILGSGFKATWTGGQITNTGNNYTAFVYIT